MRRPLLRRPEETRQLHPREFQHSRGASLLLLLPLLLHGARAVRRSRCGVDGAALGLLREVEVGVVKPEERGAEGDAVPVVGVIHARGAAEEQDALLALLAPHTRLEPEVVAV